MRKVLQRRIVAVLLSIVADIYNNNLKLLFVLHHLRSNKASISIDHLKFRTLFRPFEVFPTVLHDT